MLTTAPLTRLRPGNELPRLRNQFGVNKYPCCLGLAGGMTHPKRPQAERAVGVARAGLLRCRRRLIQRHHRQPHSAGICPAMLDRHRSLLIIRFFGKENVGDKLLRVAIINREQA